MEKEESEVSQDIVRVAQALGFLLSQTKDCRMDRVKLIKLLWAADRIHLRRYGRTITDLNDYFAMRHGPVCSLALDIAGNNNSYDLGLSSADSDYINDHFSADEKSTRLSKDPGQDRLSETDKEALREAWDKFKNIDRFALADNISHQYPEWQKHAVAIANGRLREDIDMADFFQNPQQSPDPYFAENEDQLKAAHELYLERESERKNLEALLRQH